MLALLTAHVSPLITSLSLALPSLQKDSQACRRAVQLRGTLQAHRRATTGGVAVKNTWQPPVEPSEGQQCCTKEGLITVDAPHVALFGQSVSPVGGNIPVYGGARRAIEVPDGRLRADGHIEI